MICSSHLCRWFNISGFGGFGKQRSDVLLGVFFVALTCASVRLPLFLLFCFVFLCSKLCFVLFEHVFCCLGLRCLFCCRNCCFFPLWNLFFFSAVFCVLNWCFVFSFLTCYLSFFWGGFCALNSPSHFFPRIRNFCFRLFAGYPRLALKNYSGLSRPLSSRLLLDSPIMSHYWQFIFSHLKLSNRF